MAATARLDLRAGPDAYQLRVDLEVEEGGRRRWTRAWDRRIPRRLA